MGVVVHPHMQLREQH